MLPTPTEEQTEVAARQKTTAEWEAMNAAAKKRFLKEWLDVFGADVRTEACAKCIPPWLLAAILLGEVTAMDEFLGIDERTLEELGLGDSVGLGQITIDTALKYGLTDTATNFDAVCSHVMQRRSQQLWSLEAIAAEWMQTPAAQLTAGSPGSPSHDTNELVRLFIRWELLNPLLGIRASACYLRELLDQAIEVGRVTSYTLKNRSEWGEFDFSQITDPCDSDLIEASVTILPDVSRGFLAAFFGAAHNDDALSGFREGIGLTQGFNAFGAADALEKADLFEEYNLLDCD